MPNAAGQKKDLELTKDVWRPAHFDRWERFADYLMTKEWNYTKAYLDTYVDVTRKTAGIRGYGLMRNPRFREFFAELQETKYGISLEKIREFWQKKMHGAKKEDNAMRASENLAKNLQMPGFSKEDQLTQPVNVFVGFKKDGE